MIIDKIVSITGRCLNTQTNVKTIERIKTIVHIRRVGLNIFLRCLAGPTTNIVEPIMHMFPNVYKTAKLVGEAKNTNDRKERRSPMPAHIAKPMALCFIEREH